MMDGPNAHDPVCADVVKDGNYAATLSVEIAVAEGAMDEDAMARWLVLNGPLSVALDAVGMDYYSDGIDMGEVKSRCCRLLGKGCRSRSSYDSLNMFH